MTMASASVSSIIRSGFGVIGQVAVERADAFGGGGICVGDADETHVSPSGELVEMLTSEGADAREQHTDRSGRCSH